METEKQNEINKNDLLHPIPLEIASVAGWKEVPLTECGEPLEAIGPFSDNPYDRIFTSSIYFGERNDSPYSRNQLEGALVTTFARREVANQLIEAEELLPEGVHIMVMDSFRTLDVQGALYDNYLDSIRKQRPDVKEEELSAETQKFVSIPSTDPDKPSPHNTGGSIDVVLYQLPENIETRVNEINNLVSEMEDDASHVEDIYKLEMERIGLIAQNAEMLDFGTKWDHGGPESALNYFEVLAEERPLTEAEENAKQNRRLLCNVMIAVGLEPYAEEYWHYNSKQSQMGAKTAGLDFAQYGAMELSPENLAHEQMRRNHLLGTEMLAQIPPELLASLAGKNPPRHLRLAHEAAQDLDTRATSLPKAAVIEAPEKEAA
ncbi:hypothetical protein A3F37_04170 [Candidatus Saccharibacteria bacterium RIFCSPHIGHO2_12_FULL_41_12]|nr:MAG: hypothetical protein A3F37_04170 [Candidatus Saccharibacteria bacterium RIFCSPHIGHO2_12_FULL_41_12]